MHLLSLVGYIHNYLIIQSLRDNVNSYLVNPSGLILIPGPMVVEITTLRRYWPFAAAGRALMTASISAFMFSEIFSLPKEALPIGTCTMLV